MVLLRAARAATSGHRADAHGNNSDVARVQAGRTKEAAEGASYHSPVSDLQATSTWRHRMNMHPQEAA
jgi:hypothetical protein